MFNEAFLLYLFTRLDAVGIISLMSTVILGVVLLIAFFIKIDSDPDSQYEKKSYNRASGVIDKTKWWFVLALAVTALTPSQKSAMFIIAGTGVIEAAKTDTAQRIATKSVGVIEKYLDEALAEKTTKKEK